MAKYIDGFVLVVPKKNKEAYEEMAREGAKIWKNFGALDYKECVIEDGAPKAPPGMSMLRFDELTKAKADEDVWFSYIVFNSREHRDEVNAKVMDEMKNMEEKYKNQPMPFDMNKMAYAGFSVEVEA